MGDYLYWIMALCFAISLSVILINELCINKKISKAEQFFKVLLIWVIFFCLQDAFWGLCNCNIISGDKILFASSSFFHICTSITTYFWLDFNLIFLGNRVKHRALYLSFDFVLILFGTVLTIVNCFKPLIFTIENHEYLIGPLRYFTFFNQYIVYLLLGIIVLINGIKAKGAIKEKYNTVFVFSITPILMGILQFLYPEAPFYSMGFFLCCLIVYIFLVTKQREEYLKNELIQSLSDTFYSAHIIDLDTDVIERYVESDILTNLIGDLVYAQEMVNTVMNGTVCEEYLDLVLEFVDLSTVMNRLENKNIISMEFVGKNYGWTRVSFVKIDSFKKNDNRVLLTTQIIDEEKRQQIDLIYKSNNDELTDLNNRNSYESAVREYSNKIVENNLIYISMDVNGLKVVNDTVGHAAGDELLINAAACMKRCFGSYGKVYRIGGDEFAALIFAKPEKFKAILKDFETSLMEWSGEYIDSLSVSLGYATYKDVKTPMLRSMIDYADNKMYEAKAKYYKTKGVDRRGQQSAHTALCKLYTKILKINLTDDSYQIINMDEKEQTKEKGFSSSISTWLSEFGKTGQVHPKDLYEYLSKTNADYLKTYFDNNKSSLHIFYRRMIGDEYKQVMMEMIPTEEYTRDNQSLYLYVKNIDI